MPLGGFPSYNLADINKSFIKLDRLIKTKIPFTSAPGLLFMASTSESFTDRNAIWGNILENGNKERKWACFMAAALQRNDMEIILGFWYKPDMCRRYRWAKQTIQLGLGIFPVGLGGLLGKRQRHLGGYSPGRKWAPNPRKKTGRVPGENPGNGKWRGYMGQNGFRGPKRV